MFDESSGTPRAIGVVFRVASQGSFAVRAKRKRTKRMVIFFFFFCLKINQCNRSYCWCFWCSFSESKTDGWSSRNHQDRCTLPLYPYAGYPACLCAFKAQPKQGFKSVWLSLHDWNRYVFRIAICDRDRKP